MKKKLKTKKIEKMKNRRYCDERASNSTFNKN